MGDTATGNTVLVNTSASLKGTTGEMMHNGTITLNRVSAINGLE
jgi:hypothetical protein